MSVRLAELVFCVCVCVGSWGVGGWGVERGPARVKRLSFPRTALIENRDFRRGRKRSEDAAYERN